MYWILNNRSWLSFWKELIEHRWLNEHRFILFSSLITDVVTQSFLSRAKSDCKIDISNRMSEVPDTCQASDYKEHVFAMLPPSIIVILSLYHMPASFPSTTLTFNSLSLPWAGSFIMFRWGTYCFRYHSSAAVRVVTGWSYTSWSTTSFIPILAHLAYDNREPRTYYQLTRQGSVKSPGQSAEECF